MFFKNSSELKKKKKCSIPEIGDTREMPNMNLGVKEEGLRVGDAVLCSILFEVSA